MRVKSQIWMSVCIGGIGISLVGCTYVRPPAGVGVRDTEIGGSVSSGLLIGSGATGSGSQASVASVPARIKPILDRLVLPPGFTIGVFAQVPNARSLTVAYDDLRNRQVVFVGTKDRGSVYALIDEGSNATVEHVREIAKGWSMPNGVAFKDGALYVAEISKIHEFPDILGALAATVATDDSQDQDASDQKMVSSVIYDALPKDKQHGWKYIAFGPDGDLYVPVGAPCNICNSPVPYSSIMKLNLTTKQTELVAQGVRNTVGFAWHPDSKQLRFTDNGRDNLGDTRPPDELNVVSKAQENFGFPFCYGTGRQDPAFPGKDCLQFTAPQVSLGAHVAALGMKFYTGTMFPEQYHKKIFVAEHGSRNSSIPVGYRVMLIDPDKKTYETFVGGRVSGGKTRGRPVDVLQLRDGSLLVSDDYAGVVYRITYGE